METEILRQRLAAALELAKQGSFLEARTELENLCAEAPESSEAFYYLGLACKRTEDVESARAAWERCLALDPFHHQARTQLGLLTRPPEGAFLTDSGASQSPFSEKVPASFRVQPAPLGARALAFFIDGLLLNFACLPFVAGFFLYLMVNAGMDVEPLDWMEENLDQLQWGATAISFAVNLIFIPFYYYESGMTPGKRLLGMRIVDISTLEPMSMAQCLGRFLASYISTCGFYLGYALAFFNRDRRTLHDYLGGTYVASSESFPMTVAEKAMTTLLILLAVVGFGMMAIGLFFVMGGQIELFEQYPLVPF